MTNKFPIFLVIAMSIILFSNFKTEDSKLFSFFIMGEEPVLPTIPYSYSDIVFPQHLLTSDPDVPIGYEPTGVGALDNLIIDDNIATVGRVLFYDEKLSATESISCASCHKQELSFADDVAFSEGIDTDTKRNSMALNDLFWSNKEHFLWDMRQTDLNEMIRLPLMDENEIGADMDEVIQKLMMTNYYPDLFLDAFGSSDISEDRIVEALIHFISSMVSFDSEFDQAASNDFNDFNPSEKLGLELFSKNCTSCHSQGAHDPFGEFPLGIILPGLSPMVLFPEIFNNGLAVDLNDRGAGEQDPFFNDLFKIPTLRNVQLTAPYMHDGRFETLEEVIEHYSSGVETNKWSIEEFLPEGGFNFEANEKKALVDFLNTLTSERLTTNIMWSDPFDVIDNVADIPINDLVMKPNPMIEFMTIEFENTASEETRISITSINGHSVLTETTKGTSFRLNKNNLTPGNYLVEIIQSDKRSVRKLLVQ